jgi:hypothetical protein
VVNVQGVSAQSAMLGGGMYGNIGQGGDHGVHGYDENAAQHQQHLGTNMTVNAWGVMSNNAWGTLSNNVHGTLADNVHGVLNTNVWGGVHGGGGIWGSGPSVRIYGTGSGMNHLSRLTKWVLSLFGYQSRSAREALRNARLINAANARSAGRNISASSVPSRRR